MSGANISLAYGHQEYAFEVAQSNLMGVLSPKLILHTTEEIELLRDAMSNPVGTRVLREIVKQGQKIVIVTSDLTRPTPSNRMLPFIIEELELAGIPDEDICIVLSLGLHRPMEKAEINDTLSLPIRRRFRVLNHDPMDTIELGITSRGTPVQIFRPVVEADVRICLGNVEFHYFAGYSGGAKAILPGCASRECVTANHSWMIHPQAAAGRIEDNPVRLDLEEGVDMVGIDFILNVVVDGEHNIVGAFAGDMRAAHRLACEMVYKRGTIDIPQLGDIVIASAGGFPKDVNYYQAHKALENAKYFVREGGIIILLAECLEGFGNTTMEHWLLDIPTKDETIQKIQEKFTLGGHKAAAIALIEKRATIYLISSFSDDIVKRMRLVPFSNAQEALEAALVKLGRKSQVIVLPEAGSILPNLYA